MNMEDMMRMMAEQAMSQKTKRGRKLCDLSNGEVAEQEELLAKGAGLGEQMKELNMQMNELRLRGDRWWQKVRRAHTLEADKLNYHNGAIYERVPLREGEVTDEELPG